MSDAHFELVRGERLDRYEILAPIANGGMATVYLGQSLGAAGFRRLVAIKRMHAHIAHEERLIRMFQDEANLASRLRHPNVVSTLDFGEHERGFYIVLEFVEGPSLSYLFEQCQALQKEIPIPIVLRILLDTLEGLHASHILCDAQGTPLKLVHRDISPHNILVGTDGISRLTDFGIAHAQQRLGETSQGEIKGKFSYLAPEQASGQTVDARTDLFATGIVLWELLTGKRLFQAENQVAVILKVMTNAITPVSHLRTEIDPILCNITTKALERAREKRYQTAQEFSEVLQEAGRHEGIASPRQVGQWVEAHAVEFLQRLRQEIGNTPVPSGQTLSPRTASSSHPSLRASLPSLQPPRLRSASLLPKATIAPRETNTSSNNQLPLPKAITNIQPKSSTPPQTTLLGRVLTPGPKPSQHYTTFFSLSAAPFHEVRENQHFWYGGPFAEASDALTDQVLASNAPTLLIGPSGSGKTFLLEIQKHRIQQTQAYLLNPSLLFGQSLFHVLALELGHFLPQTSSLQEAMRSFLTFVLEKHPDTALILLCIDGIRPEDTTLLEQLYTLQHSAASCLRIVLSGEAEFLPTLQAAPLGRLCQQPTVLRPMNLQEMTEYINTRLRNVCTKELPSMESAAVPFLHIRSGGIARTVNVYMHNALQLAVTQGKTTLDVATFRVAMKSKSYLGPEEADKLWSEENP